MEELINKLEKELKDFKESIKEKGIDYAINSAYELTIKQEIIDIMHYDFKFSPIEIKALLEEDCLLQDLYGEWKKSDSNFREPIMDSFDERISKISEEYLNKLQKDAAINLVVKDYFFVNEVQKINDYNDNSDVKMNIIRDMYKEILDTLETNYKSIDIIEKLEDECLTEIGFSNGFKIIVGTNFEDGEEKITENVKSIVDFSEKLKEEKEQEMER